MAECHAMTKFRDECERQFQAKVAEVGDLLSRLDEMQRWANEAFAERDRLRLKLEDETTRRQNAEVARRQSESRLDAAQKAFRAADDSKYNDWCDATKESWPVKSSAWLDLEDALFAGVVEKPLLIECAKCGKSLPSVEAWHADDESRCGDCVML